MPGHRDAYGMQLLAQLESGYPTAEIIERDDGYIDTGSEPGSYFREYKYWPLLERRVMRFARGRVLDIGCGAARHALYLQQQGFDVTGIDASAGAIEVSRARGLRKGLVRPIGDLGKFDRATFDTVLLLGNNFGLFGSCTGAQRLLRNLHRITSDDGRIIASSRNPYKTSNPHHLAYHSRNRQRGRMAGQIRMRIRFETAASPWFDYLFVSPEEMSLLMSGTRWSIEKLLGAESSSYFAVLRKSQR